MGCVRRKLRWSFQKLLISIARMSCPRLGPAYPTQLLLCSAICQPLPLRRSFCHYFEVPHPFISFANSLKAKRSIPLLHSQRQPSTGDLSSISIWELWAEVTGLHTGRTSLLVFVTRCRLRYGGLADYVAFEFHWPINQDRILLPA
jgi:hypothetical protein